MENVATVRRARGLSQRKLAELSGVNRPALMEMEAGRQRVRLDDAGALSDALGVTLSEMLAGTLGVEFAVNRAVGRGEPSICEQVESLMSGK